MLKHALNGKRFIVNDEIAVLDKHRQFPSSLPRTPVLICIKLDIFSEIQE